MMLDQKNTDATLIRRVSKLLIPASFYTALVVFLYVYLRGLDFSVLSQSKIYWGYLGLAIILGLGARFLGVYIWFTLLKRLGAQNLKKNIPQLIYVYSKSWLGRYIPGTAPWILGKIYFASRQGISKNKLAVSSLLEAGLQIAVTMSVAILLLVFDTRTSVISSELKGIMVAVLAVCIFCMVPPVFNRITSVTYRLIRKKTLPKEDLATGSAIVQGAILYGAVSLVSGLGLFLVAKAIYPDLTFSNVFFVMGAGNLASSVSMLVIFTPSGLGVREGIQLVLLSIIMPTEFALIITVATRMVNVLLDLIFFACGFVQLKITTFIANEKSA